MSLIAQLEQLPDTWGFVAVGKSKRPYQEKWQQNPLTKAQMAAEIEAGRAHAIGVACGPQSGGLLFVDHDGPSASEVLTKLGIPISELPKSWAVTSGRNGRFQVIYTVPVQYWDQIKTRKIKSGVTDDDGCIEQIELRWAGCQSIVAGSHPITGAYRWLKHRSPSDIPIAEAPHVLIQEMLPPPPAAVVDTDQSPLTVSIPAPRIDGKKRNDFDWALIYLSALNPSRANDYDQWIEVGQCLHSINDQRLLQQWDQWSASSPKYEPNACLQHWKSFKADGNRSIKRLCNLAKEDGWEPDAKQQFEKLEASQLLDMLRPTEGKISDYRFNLFTQQIEYKGETAANIELFYLSLSELGYKVGKEMALDCVIKVARENQYDPVKLYLEHVEANIPPTYIDCLASTYLRPSDVVTNGNPTLYDHMLKRTLVAAVKRVFEPGCKHDTACVLMGDQGSQKSSFWAALGGPFFSDALKDIGNKDDLMVLHSSWIMEWSEIDALNSKKHAGAVKAFLSQSTDLFRVPYGKATERFPRRCIIVASTNREDGFLVDDTGNRRFWVIPVTCTLAKPVDVSSVLLERDAIWSAAVAAYRAEYPTHLTADLENQVAEQNDSFVASNPWQVLIENWLANPSSYGATITTEFILTEIIKMDPPQQNQYHQKQVAVILKRLGYSRKKARIRGNTRWIYQLPCSP